MRLKPTYSANILSLDLATVEPSCRRPEAAAGPRAAVRRGRAVLRSSFPTLLGPNANKAAARQMVRWEGEGGTASPAAT